MRIAFVDVEEPVLNVYVDDYEKAPKVGATFVFDLGRGNLMTGDWRILSYERVYEARGVPDMLRCNILRVEGGSAELRERLVQCARKFVDAAGAQAVDDLMRDLDLVRRSAGT